MLDNCAMAVVGYEHTHTHIHTVPSMHACAGTVLGYSYKDHRVLKITLYSSSLNGIGRIGNKSFYSTMCF